MFKLVATICIFARPFPTWPKRPGRPISGYQCDFGTHCAGRFGIEYVISGKDRDNICSPPRSVNESGMRRMGRSPVACCVLCTRVEWFIAYSHNVNGLFGALHAEQHRFVGSRGGTKVCTHTANTTRPGQIGFTCRDLGGAKKRRCCWECNDAPAGAITVCYVLVDWDCKRLWVHLGEPIASAQMGPDSAASVHFLLPAFEV